MKNYYQALEVAQEASVNEIKSAYRRLSRAYHPDLNGGSRYCEEKFKEINEAYHVLADAGQRQRYDAQMTRASSRAQAHEAWQQVWQATQAARRPARSQRVVYRRVYRPDAEDLRQARQFEWRFFVILTASLLLLGALVNWVGV
ncbi:MAG: DnaJ domain-containing protein [Bernardetiaceae bacterium]|jgi:curved DNA-binding protein CbpA|nr:DnaJ domain-containing protein [Bernardetiaceae bacterium]